MSKKNKTDTPAPAAEADAAAQVAETQAAATADPSVPHKPFGEMSPEELKAAIAEAKQVEKNRKSLASAEKKKLAAADQEAIDVANQALDASGITVAKTRSVRLVKTSETEPARFEFTAKGTRDGGRDERKALDEPDLIAAGLAEFLTDEGEPVTPFAKGDDTKPQHPRTYLDAHAPEVCYYEKCCLVAAPHFEKDGKLDPNDLPADLAAHIGKPLTDRQAADILDGGFYHKDAASRALVKRGLVDTAHNVKMTNGTVQTVAEFIKAAVAPTQDVPNPPETEKEADAS